MKKTIAEEPLDPLDEQHEEDDVQSGSQTEQQDAEGTDDEVDIDRLINDQSYLAKENARQRGKATDGDAKPDGSEVPAEGLAESDPETGNATAMEGVGKPGAQDQDPIVETIVFNGTEEQVRRSRTKPLLQKGRYLEVVLEQLSPLRKVYEDPEVFALIQQAQRSPGGLRAVAKALRTVVDATAGDGGETLPEIEGYTPQEVKEAKVLLEKLGAIKPQHSAAPGGEPVEYPPDVEVRIEAHVSAAKALEDDEQGYNATIGFMKETLKELQSDVHAGKLPREQFQAFIQGLNDPMHPENFLRFFRESSFQRRGLRPTAAAAGGGGAPAEKTKVIVRSRGSEGHGNNDRLSAGGGGSSSRQIKDAWDLSPEEFEKSFRDL